MKKELKLAHFGGIFIFLLGAFAFQLTPPGGDDGLQIFVIENVSTREIIVQRLHKEEFVRNKTILNALLALMGMREVEAGGYDLSREMNVWNIVNILLEPSDLKWVTIPEGVRKEEIVIFLTDKLSWDEIKRKDFLNAHNVIVNTLEEGMFFPDTYLFPTDESGTGIAKRMIDRFNEVFAPIALKLREADIKWDTALKIASLVQKEAAGRHDMPLVAGIIWNRLLEERKLEIDATIQYLRDSMDYALNPEKTEWWDPIKPQDKRFDSPYNTYLYEGLPPAPITNPGIDAIKAALSPEETECMYYIHGKNRQIHCSVTFEGHRENIEKYLR